MRTCKHCQLPIEETAEVKYKDLHTSCYNPYHYKRKYGKELIVENTIDHTKVNLSTSDGLFDFDAYFKIESFPPGYN